MNLFSAILLLLMSSAFQEGFAKSFKTDYVSFEIHDSWNCSQVPPNWVCEPIKASEKRFAIITITSKEAGTMDQLANFEAHLKKPRSHQMGSNTPVMSQVLRTDRRTLQGQEWVQSMHLNSEVNNFYTLYLATVKTPLAVMITMSAEKSKWDQFNPIFESVLKSLRVHQVQLKTNASGSAGEGGVVPMGTHNANPNLLNEFDSESLPDQKIPTVYLVGLLIAGLALIAALYLFLKK